MQKIKDIFLLTMLTMNLIVATSCAESEIITLEFDDSTHSIESRRDFVEATYYARSDLAICKTLEQRREWFSLSYDVIPRKYVRKIAIPKNSGEKFPILKVLSLPETEWGLCDWKLNNILFLAGIIGTQYDEWLTIGFTRDPIVQRKEINIQVNPYGLRMILDNLSWGNSAESFVNIDLIENGHVIVRFKQ